MMLDGERPVTSVISKIACNSLHTKQMRRHARQSHPQNLTQIGPQESTM